jgi:hypothetical protein
MQMRIHLLILAISLYAVAAEAQTFAPLKDVRMGEDIGNVRAGSANRICALYCAAKGVGCRWNRPVKRPIKSPFVEDRTVSRRESKNGCIVSKDTKDYLGLYLLDPASGGYEQGAIFTDGPIVYGTGMSDQDRRRAWAQLFLMMAKAVDQQQGRKVLGAKLVRRCLPQRSFCTTILDANLIGIGGIPEPRKVMVIIATDIHDQNKQLSRIVCTRPTPGKQVCRDWDSGKPVVADIPLD